MALLNKFLYPLPPETETVHTVTTPVVFQHSFRQEERKRKKNESRKHSSFLQKGRKKKGRQNQWNPTSRDRLLSFNRGFLCFFHERESQA